MPDEDGGDSPTGKPPEQPIFQPPPAPPTTPQQNEMGHNPNRRPDNAGNHTAKLERDIRTGEICLIIINLLLLVTTIVIARIYYCQLVQMRIATEATGKAAQAASDNAAIATLALWQNQESSDFTLQQMAEQSDAQAKSADAAKLAAESAKGTLTLQQKAQRPWLGIVGGTISATGEQQYALSINPPLVAVFVRKVSFEIQNFGAGPAIKVSRSMQIVFPQTHGIVVDSTNPPKSIGEEACVRADSYTKEVSPPKMPSEQQLSMGIMPTERRKVERDEVFGSTGSYQAGQIGTLWMVGCIGYSDRDNNRYHTIFQARSIADPEGKLNSVGNATREFYAVHFTGFEVVVEQPEEEQRKSH